MMGSSRPVKGSTTRSYSPSSGMGPATSPAYKKAEPWSSQIVAAPAGT